MKHTLYHTIPHYTNHTTPYLPFLTFGWYIDSGDLITNPSSYLSTASFNALITSCLNEKNTTIVMHGGHTHHKEPTKYSCSSEPVLALLTWDKLNSARDWCEYSTKTKQNVLQLLSSAFSYGKWT